MTVFAFLLRLSTYRLLVTVPDAVPHLLHVGHEQREVLVVGPETEDDRKRSAEVDRLLHVDGPPARADADQPPRGQVGGGAEEQGKARRAGEDRRDRALAQAISH